MLDAIAMTMTMMMKMLSVVAAGGVEAMLGAVLAIAGLAMFAGGFLAEDDRPAPPLPLAMGPPPVVMMPPPMMMLPPPITTTTTTTVPLPMSPIAVTTTTTVTVAPAPDPSCDPTALPMIPTTPMALQMAEQVRSLVIHGQCQGAWQTFGGLQRADGAYANAILATPLLTPCAAVEP